MLGKMLLGAKSNPAFPDEAISPAGSEQQVYRWSSTTGWGTRYAGPASGAVNGFSSIWSNDGTVFFCSTSAAPYLHAWEWSSSGFGAKYGGTSGATIAPSIDAVSPSTGAVATNQFRTSPFVKVFRFSKSTGWGTAYANPAILPFDFAGKSQFSVDGNAIIVCGANASPYVRAYAWSDATGWGTAFANPSVLSTGPQKFGISFSSDGVAVGAFGGNPPIVVEIWRFNSTTGWGTKYADPSTPVGTGTYNGSIAPNGLYLAMGVNTSVYLVAYKWNSTTGWGTRYANPAGLPAAVRAYSAAFSRNSDAVAASIQVSPWCVVYPFSEATGYGTRFANPSVLPTAYQTNPNFL
jgi:hypothetical protein